MDTYLTVKFDGKEIALPIDLNREYLQQICEMVESGFEATGWEKPKEGESCYYEDALCRVQKLEVNGTTKMQIDLLYEAANCYNKESLAKNASREDILLRKLRRAAISGRSAPIDFTKGGGYTITYNYNDRRLEVGMTGNYMGLGDIIFETEEAARTVINENAEELIWYFTEMNYNV